MFYKKIKYRELKKLKVENILNKVFIKEYLYLKKLSRYLPILFNIINYGIALKVIINNKVDNVLTLIKNFLEKYIDFLKNLYKNNIILKNKVNMALFNYNKLFY